MNVILQTDVKDLGKAGTLVHVKNGFARNFLFPRGLAVEATERKVKEFQHLQRVAESKKKKADEARKSIAEKLSGITLNFKAQAGETEKLFGSITNMDISNELEKQGFSIDKRDIYLDEQIKILGQHKAVIKLGEGSEAEIAINVERIEAEA